MVDPSLCSDVTCCGVSTRRGAARFRISALALLCALSSFPAYAETARGETISNQLSRHLAITSALTEASNRFHLPVHWLRAVMRVESGGDAKSVSRKGAIGLMQLMPATGAAYLRELLDQYGEHGFLAAYNAGPGRYEDHLRGRSLPAETTDYVRRIAPALSLGGISAAPYSPSSGNVSSSIFVAITAPEKHDGQVPKHSADAALGAERSIRRSLIPARIDVKLFATDLQTENSPDASPLAAFSRSSDLFAVRGPSGASR